VTRALIEQWLPAAAIGAESLRERGSAKAYPPINFLHVWWARRPLLASRASVVASLLPAWPTDAEAAADPTAARVLDLLTAEFPTGPESYQAWFTKAIGILGDPVKGRAAIKAANETGTKLEGNGYGYPRAFTVNPTQPDIARIQRLWSTSTGSDGRPVVLDPFGGGGSIPFEAARVGCDTIANELNPVASAILQGTVVLPAQLGPAFAGTIKKYGDIWATAVRKRLESYFPLDGAETIAAYIWAHAVPCPSTGLPTPLAPDFWLTRGAAGRDIAVRLEVDSAASHLTPVIVEGASAKQYGERSTYKRGVGESVWTGETFSGDYIRGQAEAGRLSVMLLAVSVTRAGTRGRSFRAPGVADLKAIASAEIELARRSPDWEVQDLIPNDTVQPGWKTDEPRRMGLTRWSDMFMPRQLLANLTILEELRNVINEARGALDPDAVRALALYLAFAFDKMLDYNGRLSSWDATRIKIRNTFDRHDFAFKWTCAEFDAAHALVPWGIDNAVANHTKISALMVEGETMYSPARTASARVIRGSATNLALADCSVDAVVTDPPYYDNVMYAECSDYFYVWLKRSLRDTWPEFTDLVITDKQQEAVANPSLFKDVATSSGRGRRKADGSKSAAELADSRYEQLLTLSFKEAHRVLKPQGVLTVMFTHKRIDAWDTLGVALLDAGFSIDASWPIHTESEHSLHQARKNAAASTIFLACRKRAGSEPAYWADIRRDVERAAEEAAHRFAAEGMTGIDLTIATYGPVLSVLSDRWPVYTGELNSDGEPEVLRPDKALDLARERVAALKKRGLLGGRDVEFDRVTDWWLLAWSDFQAAEFPYDEARKLSIATHLELDDLAKQQKIVKQGSGSVTLLSPTQRRTAGALDPDAAIYATWLDRLHALMLIYDEEGLAATRSWLARTGLTGDQHLSDVVEAAMHAVPRVKDKGVFARPEARILDSLRASLFDHIAAPIETLPPQPGAGALFEIDGELGFKIPGELGFAADGTQDENGE
jgi:putative DNA methylase